MKLLTKSRFKMALECVTKLYYTQKNNEYADSALDDPFLKALAEGGLQVGELAKYEFCEDPVKAGISIPTLTPEEALEETQRRLSTAENIIIADAAFLYKSLFIRTDILTKNGKEISLYEVKAKSIDAEELEKGFLSQKGEQKIKVEWQPYLYDIAFQKYVVQKSLGHDNLSAYLVLVDKDAVATVDGLNEKFKIIKTDDGKPQVEVAQGLTSIELGGSILKIINVDKYIDLIWNQYPILAGTRGPLMFEQFVEYCADIYNRDEVVYSPLSPKCKNCQFENSRIENRHLKSGFYECWEKQTGLGDEVREKDLVLELWAAGMGTKLNGLIDSGKYLLEAVTEGDIKPKQEKECYGLSPHRRRMEQITRAKNHDSNSYFDKNIKKFEMDAWTFPLHMIDFETSQPALPFHKGLHPYEGIAFQFSHHVMEEDGRIRHEGQFISFDVGKYPNYDFLRALKAQLSKDSGSIFRYHNHENTYLNMIYNQLSEEPNPPDDREDLQEFIRSITQFKANKNDKEYFQGERNMIDLYDLVIRYYYSPYAKGSNSIKKILPAIIRESEYLREKYGRPIYGKEKLVPSLNFMEHVWINKDFDNDPYKTLPKLFDNYDSDRIDRMVFGMDDLRDGGAAMTAFGYLQYSTLSADQREILRDGLLRYCELDTMAMVMIVEDWIQRTGN